jgi:tetratricopeptide (TPR) repeat protein
LAKGVDYFEQAIGKDPNYAPAYSGLADCLFLQSWISDLPREQVIPKAKAAARRAIELDPSLAEPHASLGLIAVNERNWSEAEAEFNRALELNSNYPTAHHWNGIRLAAIGRSMDGIAELRRAVALDPLSPILHTELGWLLTLARSPGLAIQEQQKSLELDANFYLAHMYLARAYEVEHQYPLAISELSRAVELSGGKPEIRARLGRIYGLAGKPEEVRKLLAELDMEYKEKPIPPFLQALIYSGLGDREKELAMLEKADAEDNNTEAAWLKVDPTYDTVRTNPRFQRILQRNGLQ